MKEFILLFSLILILTTEIFGSRIPPQRRENTGDNLRISGRSFRFRLSPSARQPPNGDTKCPTNCQDNCEDGDEECNDCKCDDTNDSPCPNGQCPPEVTRLPCTPIPCPNPCYPVPPPHNGCPICRCPEHNRCPNPICPIRCENGHIRRRIDGCEQCMCRPREDHCSNVHCPTVCPSTSYNRCCGCQQSIVRPFCGGHRCINQCHNGHGYPPPNRCRCPCRPDHRPPEPVHDCPNVNHCGMHCEHGNKIRNGCPSCECEEPPISHMCNPSICRHSCPNGCYSQSTDCRNYNCLPERRLPLSPPDQEIGLHQYEVRRLGQSCSNIRATCRMHCPQGYAKDRYGCDKCECKKDEKVPTDCHLKPTCTVFCEHGFRRGPDGCEICLCRHSIDDESKKR